MARSARRAAAPTAKADPFNQLSAIASNLWWSWSADARELFERAGARQFAASNNNPIVVLRKLSAARKRMLLTDDQFVRDAGRVYAELQRYTRERTWFGQKYGKRKFGNTVYFCMEYAVHESLPLYAGGLGVLAGDHLKSASDLGLPFIAIGIFWKKGYTRQRIDRAGRQVDRFPALQLADTPLAEVATPAGRPLRLRLRMDGETVVARALKMTVGRIPLYLLDTDIPNNSAKNRRLTHVLYSGDRDTRIRQEILLGIGGWRLLEALKIPVAACHLNEGHAAFLNLERIAKRMKSHRVGYDEAARYVTDTSIFTTHTPVPAGNEEFDPELVDRYLKPYLRLLKLSHDEFQQLGRTRVGEDSHSFGMTPLALRTSRYANGVAELHGRIARSMWQPLYKTMQVAKVPIGHVTNGIHIRTWLHPRMAELFEEYLGPDWPDRQDRSALWSRCDRVPDKRLWELHCDLKRELIAFCRERLGAQLRRSPVPGLKQSDVKDILNEGALTIGFARRFAPYKRATLVFSDPGRFAKLLNNRDMPVQIIFAGKAHPADVGGKAIIQQLIAFSRIPQFRRRVVFIEDYDMDVARHMVAGVDIWLNNPERPREASGTSGMKPAVHGGLNVSILDGWWPEGYNRRNGWAIGTGKDHDGTRAADSRDARELYRVLERDVVPLYFNRAAKDRPTRWIGRMKNAMRTIPPYFNTHRQVREYLTKYYLPAMRRS